MFASSTSSGHSTSGIFGSPSVTGQDNQNRNPFAPTTLGSASPFGSPVGMSNSGGTSTWAFGQTVLPSTTSGAPSSAGLGSSTSFSFSTSHHLGYSTTSGASGHSTSAIFGCPSAVGQGNQNRNPLGSASLFGFPVGMSNSGGTSTRAFGQTALPSSTTKSGALSSAGLRSSSSFSFSSAGGSQATTSSCKLFDFGGHERGSKVAVYKKIAEDANSSNKYVSISAMPVYKDKSHEELKWEDYQLTRKGGFGLNGFTVQSTSSSLSPFSSSSFTNFRSSLLETPSTSTTPVKPNPFTNPFTSLPTQTIPWVFPGPTQPLSFSSSSRTSSTTPTSPFATASLSAPVSSGSFVIASYPSISAVTTTAPSVFSNPFAPRTALTSPTSTLSPSSCTTRTTAPCTSISPTPVSHNTFKNPIPSLATQTPSFKFPGPVFTSNAAAADPVSVSPVSSGLSFNFNQPTTVFEPHVQNWNAPTEGIGTSSIAQPSVSQITGTGQPSSSAANPFGILPPKPQMFLEGSQSIEYGISSIPVKDKPTPVGGPSLLTVRHLSRRSKMPVQKYHPKLNGPKVPYFNNNEEIPVAVYLPRESPRALVISPERWPPRASMENSYENENGDINGDTRCDDLTKEKELLVEVSDVSESLPKLQQSDYYTKPQISELEAKERVSPGFCSHVKDFVVGRHGYGSVKFLGETDVTKLDLLTYLQFNNREIMVYMDDSTKPPIGKGLNKPAEVTLLNAKCIDKKTGKQLINGLKVEKYIEMLRKKAVEQGVEFVSYDPVAGEWKFRVQHF